MRKKKRGLVCTVFFAALMLVLSSGAWAERPANPGGGPPDGHGRKPDNPGGSVRGDLLGDLWVVVRDVGPTGDGEPVRFAWEWAEACYDPAGDFAPGLDGCSPQSFTADVENGCVQPISFDPVMDLEEQFEYYPYYDSYGEALTVNLIPLDPECKIPAGYEETWGTQTIEVDSGRLALARTTDYVIQAAYDEAIAVINTAVYGDTDNDATTEDTPPVALDAAGRLVLTLENADGVPYLKTVDSPRENLALYQRLMLEMRDNGEGCLPGITVALGDLSHLGCGATNDEPGRDLLRAASFLAGAADKTGTIGIDEVVYLNNALEINTIEESATGSLLVTGYFDFRNDFTYVRSDEYDGVTADLLQPGATLDANGYPTTFDVAFGVDIYAKVFGEDNDWDGTGRSYPIVNFVRAADDAVTVINYIHNYELPEYLILEPVSGALAPGNFERGLAPLR